MSTRFRNEDLVDTSEENCNDDALIQFALFKHNVVLENKDLYADIPGNHLEENGNAPICDFEDVMTRLQKEITKQHYDRIISGKESLKSINETLKLEHANDEIALFDSDLNEGLEHSCYSIRYLIDVPDTIRKFRLKRKNEASMLQMKLKERSSLENQNSQCWMDDRNMEFEIVDDESCSPDKRRKSEQPIRRTGNGMPQRQSLPSLAAKASTSFNLPKSSQKFHQPTSSADDSMPSIVISSVKSLAPSANLSPLKGSISSVSGNYGPSKQYPSVAPKFTSEMMSPPEFETSRKDKVEKTRLVVTGRDGQGQPLYQVQKLERDEALTNNGPSSLNSGAGIRGKSRINPELVEVHSNSTQGNFILRKGDTRHSSFKAHNPPRQLIPVAAKPPVSERETALKRKQLRNREGKLRQHMHQVHIHEKPSNQPKKVISGVEYLSCRACSKAFPKDCDMVYRNHMLIKHSIELNEETIESQASTVGPGFSVWYKCHNCEQIMQRSFLERHKTKCQPHIKMQDSFVEIKKTLPLANPLRCGLCNNQFESRISLRKHLTSIHKLEKKILVDPALRCGQCLRKFVNSAALTLHVINCKEAKPHPSTVLEIAKSLLNCEICGKTHTTLEKGSSCYSEKGFVRCMLCLHTVLKKGNFFNHTKNHHGRTSDGLPCPFCDDFPVSKVQETFVHVVEKHYKPILEQAAQGNVPSPPPDPRNLLVLENYAKQRLSKEKVMSNQASKNKTNRPSVSMMPPGIVINTSRVSTAANQTGITNGGSPVIRIVSSPQLIGHPNPIQQGQHIISGSTASSASGTGGVAANLPQIQVVASPPQVGQRVQYLSSSGGVPSRFQFVTPQVHFLQGVANSPSQVVRSVLKQGPVPPGSRIIPIPNVTPVDQVVSSPVANGTNSAVVTAVTQPIVITSVSGSVSSIIRPVVRTGGVVNPLTQPRSPVFNRSVLPVRNTYPGAIGNRVTPILIAPKPVEQPPRLIAVPGTSTTQSFSNSVVSPRVVPGQKTPTKPSTSNSQTACRTEDTDAANSQNKLEKEGNGQKCYKRRLNEWKENVDK